MPPLTPEEQQIFDGLSDAEKAEFGTLTNAGERSAYLRAKKSSRPTVGIFPPYDWNSYPQIDTKSYFQEALGVSGGRRVSTETGIPQAGTYTGFRRVSTSPIGALVQTPRYFQGDEDMIVNFSREEIADIQGKMKKAGILGKYRIGVADDATVSAFRKVLEQSNRELGDWTVGLRALQSGQMGGGGLQYRVSSPDDLRAIVEDSSRTMLGRTVDPEFTNRVVKAYQRVQMEEQTAPTVAKPPQADVFAEKRIKQRFGAEADAYEFAKFAETILKGS